MIKTTGLLIVGFLFLSACGNTNQEQENTEKETTTENKEEIKTVGNDKDKHGCIASAGYNWSTLNEECIRLFEVGIRLSPIDSSINTDAFVVYNEDKSKLELFLPDVEESKIITVSENGNFESDGFLFDPVKSSLIIKGKEIYRAK